MYYPQEVLDEVLANTNIVDVVSAHVHLKKRGSNYVGLCPFHNEKTPSFNVSPSKNIFHCFGCGAGGSAITFLMRYNNSTFQEALQELADRAGITLPAYNLSEEAKKREKHRQDLLAVNKEAATYYYKNLRSPRGERGMRYFTDRGLTPETMRMFGLGFADGARSDLTAWLKKKGFSDELILESDTVLYNEKQGMHDRFWNRVMFPIQDVRGRVIGFGGRVLGDGHPKYINSSDTPVFDKGRNLYALNLAKRSKKDYLILCEGYMDVIAMHQAGFTEAVASLGTAFTQGQAALLKRYAARVLLAYDSDQAGTRAALRNIGILRSGGLESAVIDLRPHKDPDEFIKAEGKEAFQARIDGAENSFFYELRILSGSYRMEDPSQRTAFHREIARKLCTFSDDIERDNYIAAAAQKYLIKTESLRKLVAQYGNASGYGDRPGPGTYSTGRGNRYGQGRGITGPAGSGYTDYTGGPAGRQNPGGPGRGRPMPGTGENGSSPGGGDQKRQPPPSKAEQALWDRQRILLTWITDEPGIFPVVKRYIRPQDFDGPLFVQAAELLWAQMEKGAGAVSAASVISAFDTAQQQEEAAAMFSRHMDGLEDAADRGKALKELIIPVREASIERMSRMDGPDPGGAISLQELLAARKELEALRAQQFHLQIQ